MILKICVGSSCHLKDSYSVIMSLKELISKSNVEDKIELQASFCHGECVNGVTAKIEECNCTSAVEVEADGSIILHKISADNIEEIFLNKILPLTL